MNQTRLCPTCGNASLEQREMLIPPLYRNEFPERVREWQCAACGMAEKGEGAKS